MGFHFDCYGVTDIGRVRTTNDDQFVIADLKPALAVLQASIGREGAETLFGEDCVKLLVIADGIGGQPGGRRASELVVQSIMEHMLKNLPTTCGGDVADSLKMRDLLLRAVAFCESELAKEVRQCPEHQDMGTTLTAVCIIGQDLYVVHVGDSRCYVCRDGHLKQITHDHTMAQKLVDGGEMTKEQADHSKWNHVLWNALSGDDQSANPELHHTRLRGQDIVLLCTDGLTRHLSDERIAALLTAGYGTEAVCQALVHEANEAGGKDNVTVVVAVENSLQMESASTATVSCFV